MRAKRARKCFEKCIGTIVKIAAETLDFTDAAHCAAENTLDFFSTAQLRSRKICCAAEYLRGVYM